MRLAELNRAVTAAFSENHPNLVAIAPLEVETVVEEIMGAVIICTSTIHLTEEQRRLLLFGVTDSKDIVGGNLMPNGIEDEFDRYCVYEEGPGSYGRSAETSKPIQLGGLDWFIGDGDDSLAVQVIEGDRVRIWVRAWPGGAFG